MIFKITDNRIGAPALLETESPEEAITFVTSRDCSRVYRNGENVAIVVTYDVGKIAYRADVSRFPTFLSLFRA